MLSDAKRDMSGKPLGTMFEEAPGVLSALDALSLHWLTCKIRQQNAVGNASRVRVSTGATKYRLRGAVPKDMNGTHGGTIFRTAVGAPNAQAENREIPKIHLRISP
jgi:hypothetical protein